MSDLNKVNFKKGLKFSDEDIKEFKDEFIKIAIEFSRETQSGSPIYLTRDYYRDRAKSKIKYYYLYKSFKDAVVNIIPKEIVELEENSKKEKFCNQFLEIAKKFSEEFGRPKKMMPKNYYVLHGGNLNYCRKYFVNYSSAVENLLFDPNDVDLGNSNVVKNRDCFDIVKSAKSSKNRIYFVTAVIAGCEIHKKFLDSIHSFIKDRKAELILLPMRGVNYYDEGYSEDALALADFFVSEFRFNKNLRAYDMRLNPQQRDPLTGFDGLGHKGYSCIFASPKQFMRSIPTPVGNKLPHLLYSTGTISIARYRSTRIGVLASQDHVFGGLIVEVFDEKFFDIRPVQADKEGGFFDGYRYYIGDKVEHVNRVSAFVVPDWHNGFEDPKVVSNWIAICKRLNPEHILFHDLFDGRSISHHDIGKYITKSTVPSHVNTLEKELNLMVKMLDSWSTMFPESKLVIVRSNHDEHLDRYLDEGRYCSDPFNHRLALDLAIDKFEGRNPLE